MRPTVMQVNLSHFKANINKIREKTLKNCEIMPVIKANAYGTYINTRVDIINEFNMVAVAVVSEGVELRKIGYKKEIFVLNQPSSGEIEDILENDLSIGVCDFEFIKTLESNPKKVKVHIEIDTGMGRTGIQVDEFAKLIDFMEDFQTIEIEGIYTHMSSADKDMDYSNKQLEIFEEAIKIAKEKLPHLKYIHSSASNAILNLNAQNCNLVRPGMIMYGYPSGDGMEEKIDLKPVCKLKSKITFLKTVDKGTSIGYDRTFITKKTTKVATIPMGYADGLRCCLSNKGFVFINGKKAPIIGKVCMDSFMADVSEVEDVKVGDDVWIWDNENITLGEVAKLCNTTNYEILSTISNRVPREFID